VWHYRRFTLDAFRKQQEGYGEAESMLRFKHLIFFGPTGTAKWKGQIYGAPRFTWLFNKPIIYHGVFGHGLFQSIYPTPQSELAAYLSSIEFVVLTAFVAVLGWPLEKLRMVPLLMFLGTFLVALSYMIHARIEAKFDTIPARLLVAFLAFMQPLGRGWARYFTWLKYKVTPTKVIARPEAGLDAAAAHKGSVSKLDFWNETGKGREQLLTEIRRHQPHVVAMDLDMGTTGGLACLARIRAEGIPVRVLVLTGYSDGAMMRAALEGGADGYRH